MDKSEEKPKLIIRQARTQDISEISRLSKEVYSDHIGYTNEQVLGHLNHFPIGQFIAEYEGKVIGYCSSIILPKEKALGKHCWREITGNGYGSTHNPKGTYLYGVDIFVDPKFRKMRVGSRFYKARQKLCKKLNLEGIVFAGRMPLFRKKQSMVKTPEEYLQAILDKKIHDPVVNFQMRQGFEILQIIKDYLPHDTDSLGYAVQMIWHNPLSKSNQEIGISHIATSSKSVRIASVQYLQRAIGSFEEFESIIKYYVDVAHGYKCDFLLFPELFTMQLLSINAQKISAEESMEKLSEYTERFKETFKKLSIEYNVNIIAGTHPTKVENGDIHNISYAFLRDGSVYEQEKIHPTPDERYWWKIKGGSKIRAIPTDCGTIGILICYDSEFPELARHLADQGAHIIFVPFCTAERQGYLRVRYCAHARAIENQCYIVLSGNVGHLPQVKNMDIQYSQSAILTPCDFNFSRDGIAADSTPNTEMLILADLNLDALYEARASGAVLNLTDRRHDLFSVVWH